MKKYSKEHVERIVKLVIALIDHRFPDEVPTHRYAPEHAIWFQTQGELPLLSAL